MICPNCGNNEWVDRIIIDYQTSRAICSRCTYTGPVVQFQRIQKMMNIDNPPDQMNIDNPPDQLQIFGPNGQDPRVNSFCPPFDPGKQVEIPYPFIGEKDAEVLAQGGTQFSTGAVRSSDKANVRYDLISPIGMRRLAETMEEGRQKYGYFNWERGMPIGDILNHALAHIYAYLEGKPTGEDDLAHAAWNLFAAMHMEETHPNLEHQVRLSVQNNILGKHEIPKDDIDKDDQVKL